MKRLLIPIFTSLFALSAAHSADKELFVYNWSDYIDPELLQEFTQQTGVKVIYDTYDNNEMLLAKELSGSGRYDVAVPSDYTVQYFLQAKKIIPLDFERIPNIKNIAPVINGTA